MSNRPSKEPSPSNSPKSTTSGAFSAVPEVSDQPTISSESFQDFAETPQATAGLRSQSSPDLLSTVDSQPVIVVTGSPSFRASSEVPRQSQPLVSRFRSENNSPSLPPPRRHSLTPYSRLRSRSQPRRTQAITAVAMSSASSSPGSTSTAPATSGSSGNPSYQLPYAPFPYPMPANARGSGQGQQGGSQGK